MIVHSRIPALLVAALTLLIAASLFTNPPGAAPDEGAHYLKAFAAGRGELVLEDRPPPVDSNAEPQKPLQWMHQQAREVSLPARLSPEVFGCRGEPARIPPCTFQPPNPEESIKVSTYVATYPPASYVLPGLLMRGADTTHEALYLGRAGSAVLCALLLGLALFVLWDAGRGWPSVLGVLAAVSPMVIFVSSSLSGSGPEAAAGICFFAALISLTRRVDGEGQIDEGTGQGTRGDVFVWAVAAFSGFILATSRDLGVVWVALQVLVYLAWVGMPRAWKSVRAGGAAALTAVSILLLSAAASLVWQATVQTRPSLNIRALLGQIPTNWSFYKQITREQIGIFGPLDTVMPVWAYRAWWTLVLSLIAGALVLGDGRRRMIISGTIVAGFAVTALVDAAQRLVGFGAQGRHLLPIWAAVILLSAETVYLRTKDSKSLTQTAWVLMTAGVVSGVHLLAWHTVARRYSVGLEGPMIFFDEAAWAPPLGWIFWTIVAVTGVALIGTTALSFCLRNRPSLFFREPALARK